MQKKYIIGIDLGGTNAKFALLDLKAKIISKKILSTRDYRTKASLIAALINQVRILLSENNIKISQVLGVGIGVPGLVDTTKGLVHYLVNVPGWKQVRLADIMTRELKAPCFVDNDVNVMALGELYFGAGKGIKNFICITLGTGVGGGIIIDGKIYRGSSYCAGEIGHIGINEQGPRCNCGNIGCMEAYVGADYIVKGVVNKLKNGSKSLLNKLVNNDYTKITPRIIDKASREGDKFAREVWRETGRHLGSALAGVVNLINPEKIIVGGGISKAGDILFKSTRETMDKRAMCVPVRTVKIEKSKLGYEAGMIGAGALVLDSIKK